MMMKQQLLTACLKATANKPSLESDEAPSLWRCFTVVLVVDAG